MNCESKLTLFYLPLDSVVVILSVVSPFSWCLSCLSLPKHSPLITSPERKLSAASSALITPINMTQTQEAHGLPL